MASPLKKIILSGSPHSGKTTTLSALGEKGFHVVPESAITVIETLNDLVGLEACMKWRTDHVMACQDLMAHKQLSREATLPETGLVFIDSTPLDCYAFALAFDSEPSPWLREVCRNSRYEKVFQLDLVTPFNPRSETGRLEQDLEIINKVKNCMTYAYSSHGMQPIRVPLMSVEERVAFILKHL